MCVRAHAHVLPTLLDSTAYHRACAPRGGHPEMSAVHDMLSGGASSRGTGLLGAQLVSLKGAPPAAKSLYIAPESGEEPERTAQGYVLDYL